MKVKTMEYTPSHQNSFEWPVKNDILYYDTPQILPSIHSPTPVSNFSFGNKKQGFEELLLQKQTWK